MKTEENKVLIDFGPADDGGLLKDMTCFLSGGIDRVSDDGVGWRNSLKKKCQEENILLRFLDPCDKPEHLGQEIGDEKKRVESLKLQGKGKWKELQQEVKTFKRIDYRMVDMCDMYLLYLDVDTHLCGSYFECKVAEEERKPIFFILSPNMQKHDVPTWLVDIVEWEHIFLSISDCAKYLKNIDNGNVDMSDKWVKVF